MPYSFAAGDEVGQVGFKFERGSTRLFAVTVVLTNEPQAIRDLVDSFRHERGLPGGTEIKFHSTPRASRLIFLQEAVAWPLVARTLYVDKPFLPVDLRRLKSWEFYGFCLAELLDRVPVGELLDTNLVLDEFGPTKMTLRAIREQLRRRGLWGSSIRLLKRLAFRRSQSESLIQVADMFGGAIYRWLADRDETYYRLVSDKALVWAYRPAKANPPT